MHVIQPKSVRSVRSHLPLSCHAPNRRSSPDSDLSLPQSCTASHSPPAPRTPTPPHSITGTSSRLLTQHPTYACASFQLTLITGRSPRPQPSSSGRSRRNLPSPRTHPTPRTSPRTPHRKCFPIVTPCTGPSSSIPPLLALPRTHIKTPPRQHHHPRTLIAIPKPLPRPLAACGTTTVNYYDFRVPKSDSNGCQPVFLGGMCGTASLAGDQFHCRLSILNSAPNFPSTNPENFVCFQFNEGFTTATGDRMSLQVVAYFVRHYAYSSPAITRFLFHIKHECWIIEKESLFPDSSRTAAALPFKTACTTKFGSKPVAFTIRSTASSASPSEPNVYSSSVGIFSP